MAAYRCDHRQTFDLYKDAIRLMRISLRFVKIYEKKPIITIIEKKREPKKLLRKIMH